MKRSIFMALAVALGCLVATPPALAALVARYTFDDADVIGTSVIDVVGGHNGFLIGSNAETGVPGVLGEALRLPNDDGNSFVRIPASVNPAPSGNSPRTFTTWFSQEAIGSENKIFGYGLNGPRAFEISLEGGGIRLRYGVGNVTWTTPLDFVGADAGFHHLAVRVPDGAFDYLDVDVFVNGIELSGVPTGGNPGGTFLNTGGGATTELFIGTTPIFDRSGDYIGLVDDFRIYDHALSDAEICALGCGSGEPDSLVLEVDPLTGAAAIRNPTDAAINFDYYEITSGQASIADASWIALEDQANAEFPSGGGTGNGWERFGSGTAQRIAEARLIGSSEVGVDDWVGLGPVLDPTKPQDLEFTYRDGDFFRTGEVEYVASNGVEGDYNRDGVVDILDYTLWRDNLNKTLVLPNDATPGVISGSDYAAWKANFGVAGSASLATQATPEPGAGFLALVAMAPWLGRRRLRRG
ncbi:MAG: LamG-like jellyroll fold domain-containing protein [Planctomycetota bacterium]